MIQKGIAHAKSAVTVSTGVKRLGRSFNNNPKFAEREKRGFASDFANLMELLPWWSLWFRDPVLPWTQELGAADPDSIVCRNPWISGTNVNEEPHPHVPARKFLDEEETLVGTRILPLT